MMEECGYKIDLREWPNREVMELYASTDTALPCRDDNAVPRTHKQWSPHNYYVSSIFCDWLWEELGTRLDATAIIPEPVAQSVREAIKSGERAPVPTSIVDLFQHSQDIDFKRKGWYERYATELELEDDGSVGGVMMEGTRTEGQDYNLACLCHLPFFDNEDLFLRI